LQQLLRAAERGSTALMSIASRAIASGLSYHAVTSNEDLCTLLRKLRDQVKKSQKLFKDHDNVILIIDSVSMPAFVDFAMSRRYDERMIAVLEQTRAIAELKKFVEAFMKAKGEKGKLIPIVVLHPVSRATVARELQQLARKLSEAAMAERSARAPAKPVQIRVEDIPEELQLQYWRPVGGKSLHMLKEIWLARREASGPIELLEKNKLLTDEEINYIRNKLSEILDRLAQDPNLRDTAETLKRELLMLNLTKFSIYASRSRIYPPSEKLVDMYLVDLVVKQQVICRVVAQVRSAVEFRLDVEAE